MANLLLLKAYRDPDRSFRPSTPKKFGVIILFPIASKLCQLNPRSHGIDPGKGENVRKQHYRTNEMTYVCYLNRSVGCSSCGCGAGPGLLPVK
jgi:hypothetical protein